MLQAILSAIPERDIALDLPEPAWRILRRRWKNADVFLLFNEGAAATTHKVTLMSYGKRIEVWDPQTGTITPLPVLPSNGRFAVTMTLKGFETRVLVAR
jgi:hypothetical protein